MKAQRGLSLLVLLILVASSWGIMPAKGAGIALVEAAPARPLPGPGHLPPNGVRPAERPTAATYYVSSSAGDDDSDGLAPDRAWATVAKVNGMELQPGDRVLFLCGET